MCKTHFFLGGGTQRGLKTNLSGGSKDSSQTKNSKSGSKETEIKTNHGISETNLFPITACLLVLAGQNNNKAVVWLSSVGGGGGGV